MELDDLKRSWEQYDRKLTENLQLNQELLRCSNLDRSRREMGTAMNFVGFGLVITILALPWFIRWTLMYGREPLYLICGMISILFCLCSLVLCLKEIGMLRGIDYYNSPVLEIQKQLADFNTFIYWERKIGAFLVPIFLLAVYILAVKGIHKVDIFDHLRALIINMAVMFATAYPIAFWCYRNFYFKKVKAARRHLDELEAFEREEE